MFNPRISAGNLVATNKVGANYNALLQVATSKARLFNITCFARTADTWFWVTDTSSTDNRAPKHVLFVPLGQTKTLDFWGGSLFLNGILLTGCTMAPPDANTPGTQPLANNVVMSAEARLES